MENQEDLAGSRDLEYSKRLAARYFEAFPDSNVLSTEIHLSIASAYRARAAAVERFFDLMHQSRTPGRYSVLRSLHFSEHGRLTQNEIVTALDVTSANVTRLVDGLEKLDLVTRKPHPTDRRVTYVELTDTGKSAAARLVPAMVKYMEYLTRGFSDEEKVTFAALLARFERNANESLIDEDPDILLEIRRP